MFDLMDYRMQQHLAHELYRQQIMQRIPDPFAFALSPQLYMPRAPPLPDVESKLENSELWQQFHSIGTEMIITKTGRRIFPSMRVSVSGLETESNYCVLLEMVPLGDCRYKFSGSQWVPAGGAEPQSPQRMYLHPDSPATGTHWQAQPILFNKVKLTNNTLDSNGHIVLASMHKYQPRIHVIRTSDLTQIPWAPQQAFVFAETEFIAVTAYQNDRITKLKIDNNPFAKGFRESGQSRCKRKSHHSNTSSNYTTNNFSLEDDPTTAISSDDEQSSICSQDWPSVKRSRVNNMLTAAAPTCHNIAPLSEQLPNNSRVSASPLTANAIIAPNLAALHDMNCNFTAADFTHSYYAHAQHHPPTAAITPWHQQQQQPVVAVNADYARHALRYAATTFGAHSDSIEGEPQNGNSQSTAASEADDSEEDFVDVVSTGGASTTIEHLEECGAATLIGGAAAAGTKSHSFSISAILGGSRPQTVAAV